ncbi:hypothetical protein [Numidum massiliense]|uniref:hypothetical protein n=1 Tax=Numidum massiliense TaxID=1522315 RepID=UPI0011C71D84|nr:hypothetical protein [Numidum massiliense]
MDKKNRSKDVYVVGGFLAISIVVLIGAAIYAIFFNDSYESESTYDEEEELWTKSPGSTYGKDWAYMTDDQKEYVVDKIISAWKRDGYSVQAGALYFIEALNSFYGDPTTDSMSVAKAISQIGVMGGVLKKQ